jgi:hypothetical protein
MSTQKGQQLDGGKRDGSDEEAKRVKENEQMVKTLKADLMREKVARMKTGPNQPAQIKRKRFQSNMGGKQGSGETIQQPRIFKQGVLSEEEERKLRALQEDVIHRLEQTAESQGQLSPSTCPPSNYQDPPPGQFPELFPQTEFSSTTYTKYQQAPIHSSAISKGDWKTSQTPYSIPHTYNPSRGREAAKGKAKQSRQWQSLNNGPATCGNSGVADHRLETCPIPNEDGCLRGFPACNVKWHSLVDCPFIYSNSYAHVVWDYVRVKRHGLCPLEFHLDWRLFQDPANPNTDWHDGLPNTAWYSMQCAVNPGAYAALDPHWTFENIQQNIGSEVIPNARVSAQRRVKWDDVVASLHPFSEGYFPSGLPMASHEEDRSYPGAQTTSYNETRDSSFRERSCNTEGKNGKQRLRHAKRKRSPSAESFNKHRDHHRCKAAKGIHPSGTSRGEFERQRS